MYYILPREQRKKKPRVPNWTLQCPYSSARNNEVGHAMSDYFVIM